MVLKKIAVEWNLVDSFLYKIDKIVEQIREATSEEEPDVEYMIEVETQHLKSENEKLKALQIPRKIIPGRNGNYVCPNKKCGIDISGVLIEQYGIKWCPECGQRIFLDTYKKNDRRYAGRTGK